MPLSTPPPDASLLSVRAPGILTDTRGRAHHCAVGRGGIEWKRGEGDGITPVGCWPVREVLYRPDRIACPDTPLPCRTLTPEDGWCDAPSDSRYNRAVPLPYPAHCEILWREDGLYDILAVLGYNDAPVIPGRGSAIFLHCAAPGFLPTEGCVAVEQEALTAILAACGRKTWMVIGDD